MTDLAKLRELLAAATPGPWRVGPEDQVRYGRRPVTYPSNGYGATDHLLDAKEPDAALIVAAVNALPALLDELEAARAMLDQLDEAEVLVDAVNNHPNGDDINKAIESYEAAQGATDAALARLEDGAGRVTEEE